MGMLSECFNATVTWSVSGDWVVYALVDLTRCRYCWIQVNVRTTCCWLPCYRWLITPFGWHKMILLALWGTEWFCFTCLLGCWRWWTLDGGGCYQDNIYMSAFHNWRCSFVLLFCGGEVTTYVMTSFLVSEGSTVRVVRTVTGHVKSRVIQVPCGRLANSLLSR